MARAYPSAPAHYAPAVARYFLSEFVSEFSGNFEEVLDLAEEFKGYAAEGKLWSPVNGSAQVRC